MEKFSRYLFPVFLFIGITFLLAGCCTKKGCNFERYPRLTVELDGLSQSGNGMVTIINSVTGQWIDSLHYSQNIFHIEHVEGQFDLRGKQFIVHSDNQRTDTISGIQFESYTYNNDCNRCFLADNSEQATNYRNLVYFVNGTAFLNEEKIVLQR